MTMKTRMSECSTCPAHLSALHYKIVCSNNSLACKGSEQFSCNNVNPDYPLVNVSSVPNSL